MRLCWRGRESPGAAPPPPHHTRQRSRTAPSDADFRTLVDSNYPSWDPERNARARGAFAPPRRPPRESRAVSAGRPSGREVEQKVPRARANISRMDYPTDSPLGSPDGDGHRRSLFGGDVGSSDAFAIHEPSSLFGALERAEPNGNATDPHSFWDKTLGGGAGAGPSVGTRGGDSAFSASLGEEDRLEMYFEEGKRKAEERRRILERRSSSSLTLTSAGSNAPNPPDPSEAKSSSPRIWWTARRSGAPPRRRPR